MQVYSNPKRESDPHALPDVEVFEMTAEEYAESEAYEDEIGEYMRRHEFRLASMNGRVRERMISTMIEELGITGGWFWWSCFPGCLPDGPAWGPYDSYAAAKAGAQQECEE